MFFARKKSPIAVFLPLDRGKWGAGAVSGMDSVDFSVPFIYIIYRKQRGV